MKKIIYSLILTLFLTNNLYSAGTSTGSSDNGYTKAYNLIKSAKKYEKKGQTEKAQKKYAKAQKLLIKANKKKPLQADTLNYLGFTTRKLGNYKKGEEFYLQGWKIDANERGINEYLGELYVVTNRIELAKERLKVLKNCGCDEYRELKEIINGTKTSKY